jgi:hypothetical protein
MYRNYSVDFQTRLQNPRQPLNHTAQLLKLDFGCQTSGCTEGPAAPRG